MSYEEVQFEEKTVQPIPEDFELLSDYSWDMTGYTSRFGFFYLENVTRRKKKIAAATYRYQADCDGEWGEIHFDFVKRKAEILRLADWDTSRTKLYAKKIIDRILRTGGNDLPKKERIVFER